MSLARFIEESRRSVLDRRVEAAPAEPTSAVLIDIGSLRGALVVTADEDDCGNEIAIEPISPDGKPTHVWVLARDVDGHVSYSALFPSLRPGRYGIVGRSGERSGEVDVRAGKVTTVPWGEDSAGQLDDAS